MTPRPYQSRALDELWEWFVNNPTGHPIVEACVGCHAKGQGVIMFDGTTTAIEDVKIGDLLMGPDGFSREVLRLCRGVGRMYRVTPVKGRPFVVNEDHVLSLKRTPYRPGDASTVINISVREFLTLPPATAANLKLYRAKTIEKFDGPNYAGKISPYMVGVFLGDGSCTRPESGGGRLSTPCITTADSEIESAVQQQASDLGMTVTISAKAGSKAKSLLIRSVKHSRSVKNDFSCELGLIGIDGCTSENKFIPQSLKAGSTEDRLQVLAGLIDTDGAKSRGGYDFVSKSKRLSEDVAFVARSLGLAAYVSSCMKYCQTGGGGEYWRVSISGDCGIVPVRVERKKIGSRAQKKSALVTGFKIEYVGDDSYYGVTLDKDHLYLLGDFTVTHNSGKSLMIALLAQRAIEQYPGTRILVLVHQKELLAQNLEKLRAVWPRAPVGVYSAAAKSKMLGFPITYATIGSIYKQAHRLGRVDIVLADECHLIPMKEQGMWRKLISDLHRYCPDMRVTGWTGTPFRGNGVWLTAGKDALFTSIATRVTMTELLDLGFLSPLVTVNTDTKIDVAGVDIRQGDYVVEQLAAAADKAELVEATCDEMCRRAAQRKKWLVFAVTIEHAGHVRDALVRRGIAAEVVTGETPAAERDAKIAAYRAGRIRALVNVAVLTTGFDVPDTDCIVLLRATKSPVLYVQIAGRGMRIADGKADCLWLDFTSTTVELGPVDAIKGRAPPPAGKSEAPFKICDACGERNHAGAMKCIKCGFAFPPPERIKHDANVSAAPVLSSQVPEPREVEVDDVEYHIHRSPTATVPTLRVEYRSGMLTAAKEWVCLSHMGRPRIAAEAWWQQRTKINAIPESVQDAVEWLAYDKTILRKPSHIIVIKQGKYDTIIGFKWDQHAKRHDETEARDASQLSPA